MARMTYREALNRALREEMRRDPAVFVLGEEVAFYGGSFKVTNNLLAEFGDQRVLDTPISETAIIGVAIGAAMTGLHPVAELMTINFGLVAMDMIVNHAAKMRYMFGGQVEVPIVIRAPGGGGARLGAQHSQSLEAYFVHCPGLLVAVPATPADAKGLLKTAIRGHDPVLFLESELLYGSEGEVPEDPEWTVPFGKASVSRKGDDITLVTYSRMVGVCEQAAEALEAEGVSVEVIDLRTLLPLDMETVTQSVRRTGRAVVVHEAWLTGGMGAEIVSRIQEEAFEQLRAPVRRVAGADVPTPYSASLEDLAFPRPESVVEAVLDVME